METFLMDPDTVSVKSLAFLGDAVYELKIRSYALNRLNGRVGDVNAIVKELVCATFQATVADRITEKLPESELRVYKRGRNAKSLSVPPSCSISEYRRATGLETLLGYLYVRGNLNRIDEITKAATDIYEKGENTDDPGTRPCG